MTYANTTLLGLNQPATGSESGVWGDDVNNGFTQLVDLAVAGTNNITQDSDITLSVSNGNNSSTFTSTATNSTVAQYSTLNCTGARGAIRNIIAPASSRTFVVINNTTGGYAITIKKSGGTGVSIVSGETAIVYYDAVTATDYVKVSSNTITSLVGILGTANGGTGLSSFTANGVVYASSTSALATGSGLQFDGTNLGLGVTPSAWYSGYKAIEAGSWSLVYPANSTNTQLWNNLYVNTSGNTTYKTTGIGGLYSIGGGGNAHVWYYAPSGTAGTTATLTQAMTLNASGYLGIGTSSPQDYLDVYGNARIGQGQISSDSSVGVFSLYGGLAGSTTPGQIKFFGKSVSNTGQTYEIARISGISASSSYALAGGIQFSVANNNGSNVLTLSEAMRLDASGNLGLGVTPSAWNSAIKAYEVKAAGNSLSSSAASNIYVTNNAVLGSGGFVYGATAPASYFAQGSGAYYWYQAPSGTAGNAISFTQAMTLTASGVLLVGATSSSGGLVQVAGDIGVTYQPSSGQTAGIRFGPIGPSTQGMVGYDSSTGNLDISPRDGYSIVFKSKEQGTERARIDSSGNLLVGTTTSPSGSSNISLLGKIYGQASSGAVLTLGVGTTSYVTIDGGVGAFYPFADNTTSLGYSTRRWTTVYATTALINTSDATEKQQITDLTTAELATAKAIKGLIKSFKFNDAVAKKGDGARIHIGVIAQDVQKAFTDNGLDANKYGIFCSDTWYEVNGSATDENDAHYTASSPNAIQVTKLGVRYEELLAFVISAI